MTIVDKYLCKKILRGFLLALITFFFLYIIIDLFTNLQDLLKNKISLNTVLQYYCYLLPAIFIQITPVSFLLTSLYTLGTLNKSNEMVSLRTQGLSPYNIASIFLVLAFLISTVSLFVDNSLVPEANMKIEQLQINEAADEKPQDEIKNFHFYSKSGNIVFARTYDIKKHIMHDVSIFIQNEKGIASEEILASQVLYDNKIWFARNASVYKINDGIVNFEDAKQFSTLELDYDVTPKNIVRRSKLQWANLSLKDLSKQIKNFKQWKATKIVRLLKVEFHRKIAQNFALFFLLLGALPLSMCINQRRAGISALALTVILCFGYYFGLSLCLALGKTDFFQPALACWITNIFFGVSGITGMFYVK